MPNLPPLTAVASDAISSSLTDDAELANAARTLALKCIQLADHHLTHGSPQMQVNIIKAIMPAIGRGMKHTEESEEITNLRNALIDLQQQVLGPRSA